MKSFCARKDIVKKVKKQPIKWEKISANHIYDAYVMETVRDFIFLETVRDFIFLGSKITADGECSHGINRCLLLGRKAKTNLDSFLKKQRQYFADKGPPSQSYDFSRSHVRMWELNHKKAEHWRIDTFELWCWKSLESPLDCKIKPVNPKGNQP